MQTNSSQFQQKLQALEQQSKQIFDSDDSIITKESRYQNLFSEICLEEYILVSNITNLENEVLPNLVNKIQAIETEIQTIDQKKMKLDSMISGFKKLSNELDIKMETFLKESNDAQKLQHQNRDQLTQSFSLRVDEITLRLRTLETRKTTLATQYNTLQNDLRTCMDDFQHYDKLFHNLMSTPLSPSIMKLLNHNTKSNHHNHQGDNSNNNPSTSTATAAIKTRGTDKRNKKAIKRTRDHGIDDIKPLSTIAEIDSIKSVTSSSSSSSSSSSTAHMTSDEYNNGSSDTVAGDDGEIETTTAVGHDHSLCDKEQQTEITEELKSGDVAKCVDRKHEDEDDEVDTNDDDDEDNNESEDDNDDKGKDDEDDNDDDNEEKDDDDDDDDDDEEEEDDDEMSEAQNQQYEISHMIYHDFLSHMLPLEQLESTYQMELNQFVDRFGELNYGLTSSNSSLSEHEKRVRELEGTLTSLEQQQIKGKQILQEIKRVVDNETKTCQSMQESIESVKSKANKYQLMSQAFEQDIAVLQREIELYEGVQ